MEKSAISFGPFRLVAAQRLVLEGDRLVRLGSRAFDILLALVERAGEIVGKEELIARAWPQTVVEDVNLKIQVSALRRALGDGQGDQRYIITVPGQGYSFVAPVTLDASSTSAPTKIVSARAHNLPVAVTRMIGRDEIAETLLERLARHRLVTIVGPGGIGKTTVALAVAEHLIASYEDGIWLVDLGPLADPQLVPSAVATVLGQKLHSEDPLVGLVEGLKSKQMLLVLDNCEHAAEAAAALAAAILRGAVGISILTTSREPLGIAGECEYRLGPLDSPDSSSRLTVVEAASFPAVQLFVERVTAIVENFSLTEENIPAVIKICRRLDGLPLAIEFAAPRIGVLGVEGLATHLDSNLPLLKARRRATTPRHRTLRAVMDWSYDLLGEDERSFFEVLGVFSGGFTAEAAAIVVGESQRADTIDRLADLVAKSLVVADVGGASPRFRLLDTTRAYAIERLGERGERERIARRHAEYYRALFERAEKETTVRAPDEWLADYAPEIDNLRAALGWAFSATGDGSMGAALTAAAVLIWTSLSLHEECCSRAKQGLGALQIAATPNAHEKMRLHAALGASTSKLPEMSVAFTQTLDIAESLGDTEHQLRALFGLQYYHTSLDQYRVAMTFAQRFYDLTRESTDQYDRLYGERTIGVVKHHLGDQVGARRHLERALAPYPSAGYRQIFNRFRSDLRVSALLFLARAQWLLGFADQALRTIEESLDEARSSGHADSLCLPLAVGACPLSLWTGNLPAARRYTDMLVAHARENRLSVWSEFGAKFQRIIAVKTGQRDNSRDPAPSFRSVTDLAELASAFINTGRIAEALALVEVGIEKSDGSWIAPELLRLKGEILLVQGRATKAAEELFGQAIDEARSQSALSWELRATTSLACLLYRRDRPTDAAALLQPVYDKFTEGFQTADLIAAKGLLDELGHAQGSKPAAVAAR